MKHILTLAILSLSALAATAQHLGVAIEAGTGGAGVGIVLPLYKDRLSLGVTYQLPTVSINQDFSIDANVNQYIDQVNQLAATYAPGQGQLDRLPGDEVTIEGTAKLDLTAVQAKLYFRPFARAALFLAAGVRYGSESLLSVEADVDRHSWGVYRQAVEVNRLLPAQYRVDELETALRYNIDDRTFQLSPDGDGHVDVSLQPARRLCPYFGLGFGRAVPTRHRVGCQFEIGAWYLEKFDIKSGNETAYDASADGVEGVLEVLDKLPIYPQITFRITGRIF